jgi:hypothetical protein
LFTRSALVRRTGSKDTRSQAAWQQVLPATAQTATAPARASSEPSLVRSLRKGHAKIETEEERYASFRHGAVPHEPKNAATPTGPPIGGWSVSPLRGLPTSD